MTEKDATMDSAAEDDGPVGNIHDYGELEYWVCTSVGLAGAIESGYARADEARLFAWLKVGGRYELVKPKGRRQWAAVRFIDANTRKSSIALTFPRPRGKRGFMLVDEVRPFSCREIFEMAKIQGSKRDSAHFYDLACGLIGLDTVIYSGPHPKAELGDTPLSAFTKHWSSSVKPSYSVAHQGNVLQVQFPDGAKAQGEGPTVVGSAIDQ